MRWKLALAVVAVAMLGAGIGSGFLGGCQAKTDRLGRVLGMAAEESGAIPSLSARLERQLNVADLLIQGGRKPEAIQTLGLARRTLETHEKESKTMDEFQRIAGWTSISELARRAGDRTLALTAADSAVEALNAVQPEARRAEYVLSLAEEIKELRGNQEAGQLLEKGGTWATKVQDAGQRRFALRSFANRLLDLELYEAGQRVLRNEADAAWRADTLVALAGVTPGGALAAHSFSTFNRDVRYDNSYKNAGMQQNLGKQRD